MAQAGSHEAEAIEVTEFNAAYERVEGNRPPSNVGDRLRSFWDKPVSDLCTLENPVELEEPIRERHRLYAQGLMAIVWHYWCFNKRGRTGEYPWKPERTREDPEWLDSDYRGHNIAAVAVDTNGHLLDFEFNHNALFRSSAEHAEARLIRRLFKRVRLSDPQRSSGASADTMGSASRYINLDQVTIYTSLESCSQCSGVMALAQVKEVVYLQTDPGMYCIGRILRNLTYPGDLPAPLPIGGGEIGLPEFKALDAAYERFPKQLADEPFWCHGAIADRTPSVTSFLCTPEARNIFHAGRERMLAVRKHPDMLIEPTHRPNDDALTNMAVAEKVARFAEAVIARGYRGTPHS